MHPPQRGSRPYSECDDGGSCAATALLTGMTAWLVLEGGRWLPTTIIPHTATKITDAATERIMRQLMLSAEAFFRDGKSSTKRAAIIFDSDTFHRPPRSIVARHHEGHALRNVR